MTPEAIEMKPVDRKIITDNVCPPIPVRSFDWCAYFEGEEESGNYGWGTTEEAAIKDLKQRYEDEDFFQCPTCKGRGLVNPLTAPRDFFCTGTTDCPDCDGEGQI